MGCFSMRGLLWFSLAAGLFACSGSTNGGPDDSSAGAGGTSGSGASGNSGGPNQGGSGGSGPGQAGSGGKPTCTALIPCCDDSTGTEVEWVCDSNDVPQCPAGSSWPDEGRCVRRAGVPCTSDDSCQEGQRCHFADQRCGEGASGICQILLTTCGDDFDFPVCGCDGERYKNPCEAELQGVDLAVGGCLPREGDFPCGSRFCPIGDYCEITPFDVDGRAVQADCVPPRVGCSSPPTCACLAEAPCGDSCRADDQGNPTLTCQE